MDETSDIGPDWPENIRPVCIACDREELTKILFKKGGRLQVIADEGPDENVVLGQVDNSFFGICIVGNVVAQRPDLRRPIQK